MSNQQLADVGCSVCGRTDTGRQRRDNQDNLLIVDLTVPADRGGFALYGETAANSPAAHVDLGSRGLVMLVADGMGGAAAGAVASALAVSHIYHDLVADGTPPASPESFAQRLRSTLQSANARIHHASLQDAGTHGMGTTATLAGVIGDVALFAQVGDSRAYVVREGVAVQVTRDQSLVQQMIDAGTLSEEEAELSAHRNTILQALGATAQVDVDLTVHRLRQGDTILLCSDGLTRVVKPAEIADVITSAVQLDAACDALIACANDRGAPDNVTVIAARFTGAGLREPAGEPVVRTSLAPPAAA